MARSQANLQLTVFEGLAGLSPMAKLVYLALLVEPTMNQTGVGAIRRSRWSKQTGLSAAQTERALLELDAARYALFDDDTEEMFVRTLMRNDGIASQPNVLWAACRSAPLVRSPKIRRALADEFRKLPPKPSDKVLKNGRVYVHPDPHATADKIDPHPPRDPKSEPFENPSRTHVEPMSNPSDGEPFSKGSTRVGGGGGGSTSSHQGSVPEVVTFGAPQNSRPARGTRIPDDFAPTPEMLEWARALVPAVPVERITEDFCDYWASKAGQAARKVDWNRTWKRWMRKASDDAIRTRTNGHRMATSDRNVIETQALKAVLAKRRAENPQIPLTGAS